MRLLLACLLWHEVLANWTARKARGEHSQPALFRCAPGFAPGRVATGGR